MNRKQRGSTIVEAVVAMSLLATAFTGAAQVLALCAQERQGAERLMAAQLEAANVLERVAALRYDKITTEALQAVELSREAKVVLPDAKLKLKVIESAAPDLPHKRIMAEVSWSAAGELRPSARLTSWRYAPAEIKP